MSEILAVFEEETGEQEDIQEEVATPEPESESEQSENDESPEVSDETQDGDNAESDKSESEQDYNSMPQWAQKAVKDERHKRQELSNENESLKQRIAELESGGKQKEDIDPFDDPQGFKDSFRKEMQEQLRNSRIEIAQELMREQRPEYDQLEKEFMEYAKGNPVLIAEAQKARNLPKFVVETMDKLKAWNEMQNPDALREKMRSEIMESLKKEQAEKPSLSPSLTSKTGSSEVNEKLSENPRDLFND